MGSGSQASQGNLSTEMNIWMVSIFSWNLMTIKMIEYLLPHSLRKKIYYGRPQNGCCPYDTQSMCMHELICVL